MTCKPVLICLKAGTRLNVEKSVSFTHANLASVIRGV